jgi:hypothetical protein
LQDRYTINTRKFRRFNFERTDNFQSAESEIHEGYCHPDKLRTKVIANTFSHKIGGYHGGGLDTPEARSPLGVPEAFYTNPGE